MNRLLLDAGNSRVKWAWANREGLTETGWLDNHKAHAELHTEWQQHAPPEQVWLATSAGQQRESEMKDIVDSLWGVEVEVVQTVARFGELVNGYRQPQQLGVDRWLGLVAASNVVKGPLCLIDCGTAVTIDVVDGVGHHQGGVILPGIGRSAETLLAAAPHLKQDRVAEKVPLLGRETAEGLRLQNDGSVALIDEMVEQIIHRYGALTLLVAGGDATIFREASSNRPQEMKNLVLEGLFLVANERGPNSF